MRILHTVESFSPVVGGMQEVVKQLSTRLAARGHSVTVATQFHADRVNSCFTNVRIEPFDLSGNYVLGIRGSQKEIKRYQEFLVNSAFDVVSNFAAQQWATDLTFPVLKRIRSVKVFFPTGFSGLYRREYREYFAKMKLWMRDYDVSVFHSSEYRDARFARENDIDRIIVIPNGAAADEFLSDDVESMRKQLGIASDVFLILLVGTHTGLKGHVEAIRIFRLARIKNAALVIVGGAPSRQQSPVNFARALVATLFPSLPVGDCYHSCRLRQAFFNHLALSRSDGKRVILAQLSRRQIISIYKEADLFLFPSRLETSPLVIYECLASHTPFLATDVGNVREIAETTKSGRILSAVHNSQGLCTAAIASASRQVEDLFYHPEKRRKMAQSGFASWQHRFTWERIVLAYEQLYETLLREKR